MPTIIQSIKDDVENELIRLQHNEEHGALLLAWMLLLLEVYIYFYIFKHYCSYVALKFFLSYKRH